MNIFRGDKVILTKEWGQMKTVGKTYEVANITETFVVLRDPRNKIAIGSVDIVNFEEYFKKPEEVSGWTKWEPLRGHDNAIIAFYRTNYKKTQVRTNDNFRAEANCNRKHGEEFNLEFGIRIAYMRCLDQYYNAEMDKYETALNEACANMIDNRNKMSEMLNALKKEEDEYEV